MTASTTTTTPATPYRYFVSFATPYGFGNTEIGLRLPIRGSADLKVIGDLIAEKSGANTVTVLYFTALPNA